MKTGKKKNLDQADKTTFPPTLVAGVLLHLPPESHCEKQSPTSRKKKQANRTKAHEIQEICLGISSVCPTKSCLSQVRTFLEFGSNFTGVQINAAGSILISSAEKMTKEIVF